MAAVRTRVNVWVGFSDGKPHKYLDSIQVFTTKREAAAAYEDHRRAVLVVEPKRQRRR